MYPANFRIILIPLPESVDYLPRNERVVHVHGHIRYKYSVSHRNFVNTVLVNSDSLLQPVMIVINTHWISLTYGILHRFQQVPEDAETQQQIRFFSVKDFPTFQCRQVSAVNSPYFSI